MYKWIYHQGRNVQEMEVVDNNYDSGQKKKKNQPVIRSSHPEKASFSKKYTWQFWGKIKFLQENRLNA